MFSTFRRGAKQILLFNLSIPNKVSVLVLQISLKLRTKKRDANVFNIRMPLGFYSTKVVGILQHGVINNYKEIHKL